MAKRPELTDITSLTNSSAINTLSQNWDAIQEAFDNTLSLDGSTPNAMEADLDLNGNALLNVGTIDVTNLTLDGQTITDLASVPEWRGSWVTATSYAKNDLVKTSGNVYICLVPHISGTFSSDLTALKWELMVSKGDSGAGTGDMLGANNLSDIADAAAARANLALGTVAVENVVPLSKGGTGGTDASTALTNLGIGGDIPAVEALTTTGIAVRTGTSTWTTRQVTSTGGTVIITNPGGVAGNINLEAAPAWTLVSSSNTWTGGSQTISGLEIYSRIMILGDQLTADTSGRRRLRVGSGGSILTTSIYQDLGPSRGTFFDVTGTTVNGRAFSLIFERFNTTDPVKRVGGNYDGALSTNGPSHVVTTSVLDRIQVYNEAGNITGGTLYVWGMV